jgi:hypothetical protein
MSSNRLIPSSTPNDGFPSSWAPVEEPPVLAGAPISAPVAGPMGSGPYFAASIPAVMQLQPDIMPTRYPGGLGGYRIMPPGPSGVAAGNSATRSIIQEVVFGGAGSAAEAAAVFSTNGIKNADQTQLDLVEGTGISISNSNRTGQTNVSTSGVALIGGTVFLFSGAAIGSTPIPITGSAQSGLFLVTISLATSHVDAGAGTVTCSVTWDDDILFPTKTFTTSAQSLNQNTTIVQAAFVAYLGSGSNFAYSTALASGSFLTSAYQLNIALVSLP